MGAFLRDDTVGGSALEIYVVILGFSTIPGIYMEDQEGQSTDVLSLLKLIGSGTTMCHHGYIEAV